MQPQRASHPGQMRCFRPHPRLWHPRDMSLDSSSSPTGTLTRPAPHGPPHSSIHSTKRALPTVAPKLRVDGSQRGGFNLLVFRPTAPPHPRAQGTGKTNIHAASTRITPEWCFRPHPAFGIPDGTCRLTRHRQARSQGPPHTAHHTPPSTPPSEPFPQLLPTTH